MIGACDKYCLQESPFGAIRRVLANKLTGPKTQLAYGVRSFCVIGEWAARLCDNGNECLNRILTKHA